MINDIALAVESGEVAKVGAPPPPKTHYLLRFQETKTRACTVYDGDEWQTCKYFVAISFFHAATKWQVGEEWSVGCLFARSSIDVYVRIPGVRDGRQNGFG